MRARLLNEAIAMPLMEEPSYQDDMYGDNGKTLVGSEKDHA